MNYTTYTATVFLKQTFIYSDLVIQLHESVFITTVSGFECL